MPGLLLQRRRRRKRGAWGIRSGANSQRRLSRQSRRYIRAKRIRVGLPSRKVKRSDLVDCWRTPRQQAANDVDGMHIYTPQSAKHTLGSAPRELPHSVPYLYYSDPVFASSLRYGEWPFECNSVLDLINVQ